MNESITFRLQTLSPVHIGCDEIYEPTAFVVDEKGLRLTTFDPLDFIKTLSSRDKQSFLEICRKGTTSSILEIYQFMRRRNCQGRQIEICPGFVEDYRKTLSIPLSDSRRIQQELSSFAIARTAFDRNDGRPYVPGSAIKGALRTAYLNSLAKVQRISSPTGRSAARDLEAKLLEAFTIETDPFRLLKVSDFTPVGALSTRIVYAINQKKKPSNFDARGPHQILEVIEPGSLFEGTISVHRSEKGAGIKTPLALDAVLAGARSFYCQEMNIERDDLTNIGVGFNWSPDHEAVLNLRLGRHCGAESVTIEGHRDIKIMQARGERPVFGKRATTVWLASEFSKPGSKAGLRPFGWAVVEQMTPEMLLECERLERDFLLGRGATLRDNSEGSSGPAFQTASPGEEGRAQGSPTQAAPEREEWPDALVSWSPGNQILTASFRDKKAACRGSALVPEALHAKLFGKKKAARAKVGVEREGNAYRIVRIEEQV